MRYPDDSPFAAASSGSIASHRFRMILRSQRSLLRRPQNAGGLLAQSLTGLALLADGVKPDTVRWASLGAGLVGDIIGWKLGLRPLKSSSSGPGSKRWWLRKAAAEPGPTAENDRESAQLGSPSQERLRLAPRGKR